MRSAQGQERVRWLLGLMVQLCWRVHFLMVVGNLRDKQVLLEDVCRIVGAESGRTIF